MNNLRHLKKSMKVLKIDSLFLSLTLLLHLGLIIHIVAGAVLLMDYIHNGCGEVYSSFISFDNLTTIFHLSSVAIFILLVICWCSFSSNREILTAIYNELVIVFLNIMFLFGLMIRLFFSSNLHTQITVVSLFSMSLGIIFNLYTDLSIIFFSEGTEPVDPGSMGPISTGSSGGGPTSPPPGGGGSTAIIDCTCCDQDQDTMGPCGCSNDCNTDQVYRHEDAAEGTCCGCRSNTYNYACSDCACTYCDNCYSTRSSS